MSRAPSVADMDAQIAPEERPQAVGCVSVT